eukprot:scpid39751/ scgid19789/ 
MLFHADLTMLLFECHHVTTCNDVCLSTVLPSAVNAVSSCVQQDGGCTKYEVGRSHWLYARAGIRCSDQLVTEFLQTSCQLSWPARPGLCHVDQLHRSECPSSLCTGRALKVLARFSLVLGQASKVKLSQHQW